LDVLICNNPENNEGVTPLHLAAAEGHLEICQQMLKVIKDKHPNGRYIGDVNPKDKVGSTPLHYAASKGQLHICKLFMQIVADKNPRNNMRFTPLHFAEQNGHISVIELFANNLEELNKTNKNKWTPLHYAAFNGYLEVAKMLLKKMKTKNMNPNPKDVQGVTPLHLAAQKGHLAIFTLIFDQILIPLSRPSDPLTHQEMFKNPPDNYAGNTPLHFAVRSGRSSICSMILKNLDCVHPENKSGQTPLDLADGHKPILDLFKKKNFNISLQELIILRIVNNPKKASTVDGYEYPKGTTIIIKNVGNFRLGDIDDGGCNEIVKSMKRGNIFESDLIIGGTICLTIVSNENKLMKTYTLEAE
jgi:ankyrin repeat protein